MVRIVQTSVHMDVPIAFACLMEHVLMDVKVKSTLVTTALYQMA